MWISSLGNVEYIEKLGAPFGACLWCCLGFDLVFGGCDMEYVLVAAYILMRMWCGLYNVCIRVGT